MTTETRTLEVPVYRDPEGSPTCNGCQFLWAADRRIPECELTGARLKMAAYIKPTKDCPLWKGEE